MVSRAKELDMPAVAITDHGNMYGVIYLYREAKAQGIKPIIGCEVYMTRGSRFEKKTKERLCHLVLLAKNNQGYHNLIKIVSKGFVDGENNYHRPRVDFDLLEQYHEGLIATTACIEGQVPQDILNHNEQGARRTLDQLVSIFGKEDFYLEVQNHGIPEEKTVRTVYKRWSQELGLKLVATNDYHYIDQADAPAQEIKLCISTGSTLDDPSHFRFYNNEFYMKSGDEMADLFSDMPEALDTTLEIADKCNVDISFDDRHLPQFPVPEGETDSSYLRKLCEQALSEKYDPITPEVKERLDYELGVIDTMGFPSYFLIVWDYVKYARDHAIPVGPGRGSAAGSVVAYLLGITGLDPLKYNLLFERFLNPERVTMPDIDMDFCYENRGRVIQYVTKKYGIDHVSQIITFGTLAAKAAVKDVGRAMDIPLNVVNQVNKLIPNTPGTTLKGALEGSRELRELRDGDPSIAQLLDFAQKVEGMPRHTSTHAAGVVITPGELTDYVPLQITSSSDDEHEYICTQYDKDRSESLGLLKMDLLGLRTLTVIDDALKMIKKNQGTEVDIRTIDLHDPKTCRMLCKGDTAAVFQMESDGMTRLMKQLAPEGFEDLIPLVALYRPGPLGSGMAEDFIAGRHGRRTAQVLHPLMEPIVADTYGVILYQEQVMQIVSALGGFTLGEADILRRAMGKKKAKLLDSMKEKFLDGAQKLHGISRELGSEIFALLQHFAGYGFNKSHSAAYALVAYHTAWLKANYPVEYMAAFLNSIITVADKVSWYIGVCRDMGIQVLPPDINTSEAGFSVDGHTIRFGLGAIKSVGDAAVTVILEERKKRGPFRDFFDFTRRVDLSKVNKRVVEALIKCGSMNGFGLRRSQLLAIMDPALEAAASEQRDRITGQLGLFGEEDIASANTIPIPNLPEIPKAEILRLERELIGFYVTGHPLDAYRNALRRLTPLIRCTEENYKDGERIAVGGIITDLRLRSTKNGDRMASFVLEDLTGSLTVIAFPRAYAASRANIDKDRIVMIQGILKLDEEQARIFANRVEPLQEAAKEVHLHIGPGKNTQAVQQQLGGIFAAFHGKNPVYLHVADTKKVIRTNPRFWVDLDAPGFADAIERVLGKGSMEW